MSPVAILIAILGVIVAAVPIYYLAKSNSRENRRLHNEQIATAVRTAVDPLLAANAEKDRIIGVLNGTIATREKRIEQLEDERARRNR